MFLHRAVLVGSIASILAILGPVLAVNPASTAAPAAPVMLTTHVYIPIIGQRRLDVVCGADTNPADVLVEYLAPNGAASTITTLNMAANGSAAHHVNSTHPMLAGGLGAVRLLSTNPNPGNFYAFMQDGDAAFAVSGTAMMGSGFRVPYVPVTSGGQRIRVAITNPNAAPVTVNVVNIGGGAINVNLQPQATTLWDSEALGEIVNSNSAVRVVSIGGDVVVAAAVTRNGITTYSHPHAYEL